MMYIQHPTIMKFVGYSPTDFNNAHNMIIIMELAQNGSLQDAIKNIMSNNGPPYYCNTTRQIILVGVARGMKFLHDRNIIHRDLKPGNILLNAEFQPLLTDFGMAIQFGGTKHLKSLEVKIIIQKLMFMLLVF